MKKMSYAEAIREAMSIRMREDPNVLLFGEDVGAFGGCFGVSAGMFDEFGEKRVRDTPISEGAIIGAAVGSAATGLRPIAELMFCDFLTVGMDQLVNQAAKMRYMFGGKISLPMVVRLPCGAGVGAAAQHSQSLEAWMTHVPGLKVFYPQLGVKLCSMAGGGVQKIYMVLLREPSRRDRSGSDLFHLRDGFEIKMNFDRNVSCFIFVNAFMHDDFFD